MQHLLLFTSLLYLIISGYSYVAFAMREFSLIRKESKPYTVDFIIRDGYPVETHDIVTNDGYIINVQRIPGKLRSTPILIIHGLYSESHNWVINGKELSLPYVLADEGFDVWLGNVRGNLYGKMHVKFTPSESQFWNFSMDEIGIYDLPGMISYIYNMTHQRVVFIGYSMGAVAGLIMNVKRHDMDAKVRLMVHIGPPVFMNTAPTSSKRWIHFFSHIKPILEFLGIHEGPPGVHLMRWVAKNGCNLNNIIMSICEEILLSGFHYDRAHVSHSTLTAMTTHILDTTSLTVINHFVQWIKSGHFRQYDHGIIENIKKYRRIIPPDYDISDINVPTAVFYTESDDFVSPQAIYRLYHLLSNKAGLFKVNDDQFSHQHFAYATNARDLVYLKIISIVKLY